MAGLDPDIFGSGSGGLDPDIFGSTSAPTAQQPRLTRKQIQAQIENDPISQGAREFARQPYEGFLGVPQRSLNLLSGMVRGAGSIGSTVMYPLDKAQDFLRQDREPRLSGLVTGKQPISRNQQRRQDIDEALTDLVGADPKSFAYQSGKLGTEVAGTAAIPGVLGGAAARLLPSVGASPAMVNAVSQGLASGGFNVNGATGIPGMAIRMATGGVSGGATAGMIDPKDAGTGFVIGSLLPPAVKVGGAAGELVSDGLKAGARRLMQSAVKPTIKQLRTGDAATAIDVMLENGISPNAKGVQKLEALIDDVDNQITQSIAGSTAVVNKGNAVAPAIQARSQFGTQVSPTKDVEAIDGVIADFLNHPQYPGSVLSVQDAQRLKQGTYRVLAGKYGELGSAATEAQKAIARGLKDEIAAAVPGVADANAALSGYLTARQVAERRALMAGNNNPLGLAAIAPTKAGLLTFLADRSTDLKALGARGMYSLADLPVGGLLSDPATRVGFTSALRGLLTSETAP